MSTVEAVLVHTAVTSMGTWGRLSRLGEDLVGTG